ncbi:phosphate-starvation-inducible PsiE family protein [Denitromonas sp.]|uniref:phosphate-starvation-inducible PsiE family protein n=1 Tax=Denitromonas sp. TaxID=2734609 RepID=UPI003A88FE69
MLHFCHVIIRFAVRVPVVMMTGVVLSGIGDVVYVIYQRLMTPPLYLLNISDIYETFAAFLAVLVAIEIFVNIRLYLKSSVLPVKLVLATALMAVARKAIVLDFSKHDATEC